MLSLTGRMRAQGRPVDLDAEWRAVDDLKREAENPIEAATRTYFREEMERVLSRLRSGRMQRLDEPITVDDVFSVQEAIDELLDAVTPALRDAIEQGFLAGLERIDESGVDFDADNPAVRLVTEQVNENLRNVPRRTRERINDIILQGFAENEDIDTVAANIRGLYEGTDTTEGMTEARSRRIAQTSGTAAFERGQLVAFEDVGLGAKEWLTTRDGRQRDGHDEANFQIVEIRSPFSVRADEGLPFEDLQHPGDPTASVQNVVNCFPGDTRASVVRGTANKLIRSRFNGQLVTIETASGYKLTATPNHPVISQSGRVAASLVEKGMEVVVASSSGAQPPIADVRVDDVDVPTFEKAFELLQVLGARVKKVTRGVNLYGRRPQTHVDIIDIDRLLWDYRIPFRFEELDNLRLEQPLIHKGLLRMLGLLDGPRALIFGRDIAPGVVSGSRVGDVLRRRSVLHHETVSISDGAARNVAFVEPSLNDGPAHPQGLGKGVLGLSSEVATDQVVNVEVDSARHDGYVYTMETSEGVYSAQGLLVSNCRCTMLPKRNANDSDA